MKVHINLVFGTTEGKSYTIRVPYAINTANIPLIKNSMNSLISANCVKTGKGDLSTRDRAELVRVTIEEFDVN